MGRHYPSIAGDPPLGHKKAERWARIALLWKRYVRDEAVVNDVGLLPPTNTAPGLEPCYAQSIEERRRWRGRQVVGLAKWASNHEPRREVCAQWAGQIVEAELRRLQAGFQLSEQMPPVIGWDRQYTFRDSPSPAGWRPSVNSKTMGEIVHRGPSFEDYLSAGGHQEELRPFKPTLRSSLDPCRPPFHALRFACQAVWRSDVDSHHVWETGLGINEKIKPAAPIGLVCGGGPLAGEYLARFFRKTPVHRSRHPLEPELPPGKLSRIVINVPSFRALAYVERLEDSDPEIVSPWEHEALLRGVVTPEERRLDGIVAAGLELLDTGGRVLLLGATELDEYWSAAERLKRAGLIGDSLGAGAVDTVDRPLHFAYEQGSYRGSRRQGPWAPYRVLWPSDRLVSVWRAP